MRAVLLPAAGASSRMRGGDKLLEQVDGVVLLRRSAIRARGSAEAVLVTLPVASPRRDTLSGLDVTVLEIDATEGMAASLRAGADWAIRIGAHRLMIALPDMPDITTDDLCAVFNAQAQQLKTPLRATTADGQAGHPVILPREVFAEMRKLSGDQGARTILRDHPPRLHPLPGQRALTDLDTPEAWAAWRAEN